MTELQKQDTNNGVSTNIVNVLSGIVGIGAIFYGMGLLVLIAQLYETYFPDFRIALYAASLVPNTIVLGQAAYGFANLGVLIFAIILSFLFSALVIFLEKERIDVHKVLNWFLTPLAYKNPTGIQRLRMIQAAFGTVLLPLLVIFYIIAAFRSGLPSGVLSIGLLIVVALAINYQRIPLTQRVFLVIVISYFSALSVLLYDTPPTIPVQVSLTDSSALMEGELLAQSSNYLHIIVEQDRANREFLLISIPSDQVDRITISTNMITYAHPGVSPIDLPSTPTTYP
jgi:hypothetical protein